MFQFLRDFYGLVIQHEVPKGDTNLAAAYHAWRYGK